MTDEMVRITYPVPDPDIGGRRVDVIPVERDAIVVWRDQFGSTHLAAFGEWAERVDDIEAAIKPVTR